MHGGREGPEPRPGQANERFERRAATQAGSLTHLCLPGLALSGPGPLVPLPAGTQPRASRDCPGWVPGGQARHGAGGSRQEARRGEVKGGRSSLGAPGWLRAAGLEGALGSHAAGVGKMGAKPALRTAQVGSLVLLRSLVMLNLLLRAVMALNRLCCHPDVLL